MLFSRMADAAHEMAGAFSRAAPLRPLPADPRAIALVGNGLSAIRHARDIDDCELVVRLNRARHCGRAGKRTDVLALVNWSHPGHDFATGRRSVSLRALRNASEIWLTMHPDAQAIARAVQRPVGPPGLVDFTEAIIGKVVKAAPHQMLPAATWTGVLEMLREFGAEAHQIPSTGAVVLRRLTEAWPAAQIRLFGFSHEGWEGHPWEAERKWMRSLDNVVPGR